MSSYLSEDPGIATIIDYYRNHLDMFQSILELNPEKEYFLNVQLSDNTLTKKLKITALDTSEVILKSNY